MLDTICTVADERQLARDLGYTYVCDEDAAVDPETPLSTFVLPTDWWTYDGTNIIVTELILDDHGRSADDTDQEPDSAGRYPQRVRNVTYPLPAQWFARKSYESGTKTLTYSLFKWVGR